MKFKECIDATASSDVQGIPQKTGPIVRRKLPAGYTKILDKVSKKKKKRVYTKKSLANEV